MALRANIVALDSGIKYIINKNKLLRALKNIKNFLKKDGIIFVSPISNRTKKTFFYLKFWSYNDIIQLFTSNYVKKIIPFKMYYNTQALIIKKK